MGTFAGPIAITALPGVAAATVGWRRQGQDFVTAVIKVSCALQSNRPMAPVAPEPITADEQPFEGGVGLRSAGDLAPYLAKTDVCLIGHAKAPPGATRAAVRLGVLRDGTPLLDTWVEVEAASPGGEVVITGMGPIAADWPLRARLLGGASPSALKGPILDLPISLDWAYFQAAPLDQQIAHLRGDEWIGISGVDASGSPWMTRLPEAKAALRLYGRAPALRAGKPIAVSLDTVLIDVDRRRALLAWRGHIPISHGTDLSALHFMAALEQPGRLTPWADPFASIPAPPAPQDVAPVRAAAPRAAALPAQAALPSKAPRRDPPPAPAPPAPPGPQRSFTPHGLKAPSIPAIEDHPLAGTREVTSAALKEAMPFRPSDRPPPPPARPASIPPPPGPQRSFTPHGLKAPSIPAIEDHPLAGTREVTSPPPQEAMPFRPSDRPLAPSGQSPSVPPAPAQAAPAMRRSLTPQPFLMALPFSAPRTVDSPEDGAAALSAQFLAGMAEAMAAGHVLEDVAEGW